MKMTRVKSGIELKGVPNKTINIGDLGLCVHDASFFFTQILSE